MHRCDKSQACADVLIEWGHAIGSRRSLHTDFEDVALELLAMTSLAVETDVFKFCMQRMALSSTKRHETTINLIDILLLAFDIACFHYFFLRFCFNIRNRRLKKALSSRPFLKFMIGIARFKA